MRFRSIAIPLLGAAFTLSSVCSIVHAQAPAPIPEVPLEELATRKITYTPISLAGVANRNFQDDAADNGQGGWTDQGPNSVPNFPTGRQTFEGIPFDISAEVGKQLVVLRGQNKTAYPTQVDIPVNRKGAALYFLHTAAWGAPVVAKYVVRYADGQSETLDVTLNRDIFDWWSPSDGQNLRIAWKGSNPERSTIGLGLFAWRNPRPTQTIAQITAQTTGDASFLMLAGITLASEGPYLTKRAPKFYDTANWFPYTGVDVAARRGTALDVSYLLDKPAGKNGWLKRLGEDFVWADGRKQKFWGVNVVASMNFPTHEQAENAAELMAQSGINITRHHHMDADWTSPNIFGNADNTQTLNAQAMERFDYFVYQLQKRGIYQYFDLIVNRRPFEKDGIQEVADVNAGYKIEGQFDPHLIQLQENFTRQFLNHKNPYTGKAYGEDPAVAMLEIINEDSLFYRNGAEGDFGVKSAFYQKMWNEQYNAWLRDKFGGRAVLEARWKPQAGDAGKGLQPGEDPIQETVQSITRWEQGDEWKQWSRQRALDNYRFYYDQTSKYFDRMQRVVRPAGYKGLIAGSNHWTGLPIDLYANAQLDYIDRHDYWAHPEGGYGYAPNVKFNPESMTRNVSGGIIGGLGQRRVKGLPYIVTEWQQSAPNDYRQEGALFMAAYGAFQNWSSVQFAWSHSNQINEALGSNFDIVNQPGMLGIWPAMSLLLHRGDVTESKAEHFAKIPDSAVFDPATRVWNRIPGGLQMVGKTGIEFSGKTAASNDEKLQFQGALDKLKTGSAILSANRELEFDSQNGWLRLNTPRTQGFTGFSANKLQTFSNLEVTLQNAYGLVVATSLEMQPLNQARRVLISAIGNSRNTGMEISNAGNMVVQTGTAPVLVEPLLGRVQLKNLSGELANIKVFALDPSGRRTGEVPIERVGAAISFDMKADYKTMFYEVVR